MPTPTTIGNGMDVDDDLASDPPALAAALFLSHANTDQAAARSMRTVLEGLGYRCWLASDDIEGEDWPAEIASAVADCGALIVVVSTAANQSRHVAREVTLAIERDCPVLPVRIEDVAPEGALKYLLAISQWVDLFPGPMESFADLLATRIDSALSPAPEPTASAAFRPSSSRIAPPLALSSFVGREQELAEVAKYLMGARMVTLVGMGGTGKTRLAEEAARGTEGRHGDPVWVDLAAVEMPGLVISTVATSLGVSEEKGRSLQDSVAGAVADSPVLLVVDNCEHLLDAVAGVVDQLLRACPQLRVLATSRQPLGVDGEATYLVPPLALPPVDDTVTDRRHALRYDGIKLFVERAELANPDFRLTGDQLAPTIELCARLDGIPLAIELAAARLSMLSLEELSRRLEDRFAVLTGGSRTALPRHRTLEATIDWSYQLLSGPEQRLFQRLSVFRGGGTLEAVEQICSGDGVPSGDIVELVGSLLSRSLVLREEAAGTTRFRQLETLRVFAASRLSVGAPGEWDDRHAAFYLGLAEQVADALVGPGQDESLAALASEHGNLRVALTWLSQNSDSESALRMAVALRRFWLTRGHWREALEAYSSLIETESEVPSELRASALRAAGTFAGSLGEYDRAVKYLRRSVVLAERLNEGAGLGKALMDLGAILGIQRETEEAKSLALRALSIAEEGGDDLTQARALSLLAWTASNRNEFDNACQFRHQALAVYDRLGDHRGMCVSLLNLGDNALHRGDLREAETFLVSGLQAARSLGDVSGESYAYDNLGWLALLRGDYQQAHVHLVAALRLAMGIEDRYHVLWILDKVSGVAAETGCHRDAAILMGAVQANSLRLSIPIPDDLPMDERTEALRFALGEVEWPKLVAQGELMDMDAAVDYALDWSAPAEPARR